jgi:hypothetical protein
VRVVAVRLSLVTVSLAATLLVAEGVARLVLPVQQTVDVKSSTIRTGGASPVEEREDESEIAFLVEWGGEYGVRLSPGVRATVKNHRLSQREIVIEVNSLGLRHPELGPKREDEFRVLVLGDSIVFGDYLAFSETVTARLQSRFEARRPRITVINAGLPGANTWVELHHYLEIRTAVDPDLVLLGMYLNDAAETDRFYARSLAEPLASSRFLSWIVNRVGVLRAAFWTDDPAPEIDPDWREDFRAGRHLDTGDFLNDPDAADFEIYNAHADFGLAWNPQAWRRLERIVGVLVQTARHQDHDAAAFLFPVHFQAKGTVGDDRPQQSFHTMCRAVDIPCFDVLPVLQEDWRANGVPQFYDHCHLNVRANRVVAEALGAWLDDQSMLPPPHP